jgi:hypothetical protein
MSAGVEVLFTPWPYDAVARGVELLDEKVPGWRQKITLDKLAMSSCSRCVIGQIFGYFDDLALIGGTAWLQPGYFGFDLGLGDAPAESLATWDALTDAWREAIAGGAE